MWTAISTVSFLVLIIAVVLLLPVYISVKLTEGEPFFFDCKILNITLFKNASKESEIEKRVRKKEKPSKREEKPETESKGTLETIRKNLDLIKAVLGELRGLLGKCTAKVFRLNIIISTSDAAKTAIAYGECCALVAPLLGYLHSVMKIKEKGKEVNVLCDYSAGKLSFSFETTLSVRVFRIIAALARVLFGELRRRKNKDA